MHGFAANPIDKPGYRLDFTDEFEDLSLDTRKWLPFYLPQWSSRSRTGARYALTGHSLRLHIDEDQPAWSPEHNGALRVSCLQTGCVAGEVGSNRGQHHFKSGLTVAEAQPASYLYTPQYGYFEIRMKTPRLPGYMGALWMIGIEDRPAQSAEICVCEIFGQGMTDSASQIGYGVHPFGDPALTDEFYQDMLPIDASQYHIYAVEWTPTHIDFFVDNVKTRTIRQSPAYPMQFMLTFYELPDQLPSAPQTTAWPKVMEVDYVRGYQPLAGYSKT